MELQSDKRQWGEAIGNTKYPNTDRQSIGSVIVTEARLRHTQSQLGHLQVTDPGLFDGWREGIEHSRKVCGPARPAKRERERRDK
jgi:hypothetical protein